MARSDGSDRMARWTNYARLVIGIVFVVSGIASVYTAATNPEEYRSFSETALTKIYSDLIDSVSVSLMPVLLAIVGIYEFTLGALTLTKGPTIKIGLTMGIVFALAISMLGLDELPALALVPIFAYMLTKDFSKSALGSLRSDGATALRAPN